MIKMIEHTKLLQFVNFYRNANITQYLQNELQNHHHAKLDFNETSPCI